MGRHARQASHPPESSKCLRPLNRESSVSDYRVFRRPGLHCDPPYREWGLIMFHAPTSESKRQNDPPRNRLTTGKGWELSLEVPAFSAYPLLRDAGGGSLRASLLKNSQQQLAHLHSTYGNQAVLRLLSRAPSGIQTKLTVNQPGDQYEQEADRVADHVMRMTAPPDIQRKCSSCEEEDNLQRKCAECEEEEKNTALHRKEATVGPQFTPPSVHAVLHSPGQPLDWTTRMFMEQRFGYDFGHVRVHTGAKASESARSVNALAYTVGEDTVFAAGQYAPASNAGRKLIAHELAHVLQQSGTQAPALARQLADGEENASTPSSPTDAGLPGGVSTPASPDTSGDGTGASATPSLAIPSPSLGAAVQVCARDLQVSPVGHHAYIEAPPFRYAVISPTCPQKWSDNPITGTGGQKWDNSPDPCGKTPTCIDCNPAPGVTDVNRCLRDVFTAYNNPSFYRALGPNSNTFAGTLARACCDGMTPKPPALGWCPGWDDPPAAAYGSLPCPPGPTC